MTRFVLDRAADLPPERPWRSFSLAIYTDGHGGYRISSSRFPPRDAVQQVMAITVLYYPEGERRFLAESGWPRQNPPSGALRGDPSKQHYCLGGPHWFYLDQNRGCTVCGARYAFTAEEQRHWYEELGFWHESVPRRCPGCRRERQQERRAHREIAAALAGIEADRRDAAAHSRLARWSYRLLTSQGEKLHGPFAERASLARAIGAARAARTLAPEGAEGARALYYEGLLHELAGRSERALECMQAFVALETGPAEERDRARRLVRRAERRARKER